MPAPSRPNFVRRLLSFSRQLSSRPSRRGRMCKKTVTTTRWAARKRRRAWRGRRRSAAGVRSAGYRAKCDRGGGSWFLGHVRRRDGIANEKIALAARRTIIEGSRTIFVVGAYRFGANFPVQPPNFPSQPVPHSTAPLQDLHTCSAQRLPSVRTVYGPVWYGRRPLGSRALWQPPVNLVAAP